MSRQTEAGQRHSLILSMMMFDSSGGNEEASREEHLEALRTVIASARSAEADVMALTRVLDWLMAHRDGPDNAKIVFPRAYESDAGVIV